MTRHGCYVLCDVLYFFLLPSFNTFLLEAKAWSQLCSVESVELLYTWEGVAKERVPFWSLEQWWQQQPHAQKTIMSSNCVRNVVTMLNFTLALPSCKTALAKKPPTHSFVFWETAYCKETSFPK